MASKSVATKEGKKSSRRALTGVAVLAVCLLFFAYSGRRKSPGLVHNLFATSTTSTGSKTNSLLIVYSFFDTNEGRRNLDFLLRHGWHANADWLFVVNGYSRTPIPRHPSIRVLTRPNTCRHFVAFTEALTDDIRKRYQHFIFLDSSVRGPFLPRWSKTCWTKAIVNRLKEDVKLVGLAANCIDPYDKAALHLVPGMLATDQTGLSILTAERLWQKCAETEADYLDVAVDTSSAVIDAGYELDALYRGWLSDKRQIDTCVHPDPFVPGNYFDFLIHPFETMFVPTGPGSESLMREQYTKWAAKANYSSTEYCMS